MADRFRPVMSAIALSTLLLARPAHGQGAAAAIVGVTTAAADKSRLIDVTLVVTDASGQIATTRSDEDGRYRLSVPQAGTFQLIATHDGFAPAVRSVTVSAGATVTVDIELVLASLVQSVEVRSPAPTTLNPAEPASPSSIFDGRRLVEAPLSSGSLADALQRLPGITLYGREWVIKGGRPNQTAALVDDAPAVDPITGSSLPMLPGNAIERIRVLANPYLAEFGRFSTGVIALSSRSGTNAWHVSAGDVLPGLRVKRGSPIDVIGIASLTPSVSLSGPLKRNRVFLFQSLQARYFANEVLSRPQDQLSVRKTVSSFTRVDFVLSARHLLSATLSASPANLDASTLSTFNPPEATADIQRRTYRIDLAETAVLPRGMTLVTRVQFFDNRARTQSHGSGSSMTLAPEGNGGAYFVDSNIGETSWQASATLSGVRGPHTLKAGVDVVDARLDGSRTTRPIEILREDGTRIRELSATASKLRFGAADAAVFAQDRWLMANRVLFDAGVRLERDGLSRTVNLAPRLGAAVTLDRAARATLRGGWGYFFERIPTMVGAFGQQQSRTETAFAADGVTVLDAVQYNYALGRPLQTPRSVAWNLAYEQRIGRSVSLRVNHLERRGTHELVLDASAVGPLGSIQLTTTGHSRYIDTEVGLRLTRSEDTNLDLSYTHSASRADLNAAYDYFLSATANPIVRANATGPTDASVPNRFVARGQLRPIETWRIEVRCEVASGVPYSSVDEALQFVGSRNARRFPVTAALDLSIDHRVHIGSVRAWVGFAFTNILHHARPEDVQANVASPVFGQFFAPPKREVRLTVTLRR